MNWDETRDFLSPCFPECIRDELAMLLPGELREIRIRAERPAVFVTATRTAKLDWIPGQMQVEALTEALSGHSLFARADETRRGYLTLRGGHRMGLCGHITRKNGQSTLRDIASVCIRIAGEWRGCADGLISRFPALFPGKTPSVLIIGAPGSGKTTLVQLIPRFYDATEGAVLIDGVNVKDYSFDALYDKLGYVTQKAVLFSGTVRDNVLFGESAAGSDSENLESAIALSQAKEFVDKLPEGTNYEIEQLGRNVSGGQKQRLSIARALARKPEILVFDDSFSALDYRTDAKLREGLNRELHDVTKIIVAQRISTIRHAEKILVLDRGEIAGRTTSLCTSAKCTARSQHRS